MRREAGARRIEEDEIGEGQPGLGIGIGDRCRGGRERRAGHRQPPGPHRADIEEAGRRARAAIDGERDRARRGIAGVVPLEGDIGDIRLRRAATGVDEPHRACAGGESEALPTNVDRMRCHRFRRQRRARRRGRLPALLGAISPGARGALLRRRKRRGGNQKRRCKRANRPRPVLLSHDPLIRRSKWGAWQGRRARSISAGPAESKNISPLRRRSPAIRRKTGQAQQAIKIALLAIFERDQHGRSRSGDGYGRDCRPYKEFGHDGPSHLHP